MLYTFSQACYDKNELQRYFRYMTENDAVVLWQNGVFLAIKESALLTQSKAPIYVLETDAQARGLTENINTDWLISVRDLVDLTNEIAPQFAL